LTKRDGSFLLAREENPDFTFDEVIGKTIIGGRKGGMPEMTLEWVLKQNGIVPDEDVAIDTSIQFAAMTKIAIEQDFYASIYLSNMAELARQHSDNVIKAKNKGKELKHEYKTNLNV